MPYRPLNADDIFISYTRRDASTYANGLASELGKRNLHCYLDALGTEPGAGLPESLKRRIRNSHMFVLICTRRAGQRETIRKEIEEFLKTGRKQNIVPVDINRSFYKASWLKLVEGVNPTTETSPLALKDGRPSPQVVERIDKQYIFRRGDERRQLVERRAKLVLAGLLIFIAVATSVAGYQSFRAVAETKKAQLAEVELGQALAQVQTAKVQAKEQKDIADLATKDAQEKTKDAEEKTKLANDASRKAQHEAARAKVAQGQAEKAKADATEQKRLAGIATKDAEEKTKLAEEAARKEQAAERKAGDAQVVADREQLVAESRSLANRSATVLRQHAEEVSRSLEYAVESMNKSTAAGFHLVEADTALRESLALFPHLRDSYQVDKGNGDSQYVGPVRAISPDGRYFGVVRAISPDERPPTVQDEKLRIYDSDTKALVKVIDCQCSLVALSSGPTYVAAMTERGLDFFDLKDGSRRPLPYAMTPDYMALSPSGRYLALAVTFNYSSVTNPSGVTVTRSGMTVLDTVTGKTVVNFDYPQPQDSPVETRKRQASGGTRGAQMPACDPLNIDIAALAYGPTGDLAAGGAYSIPEGSQFVGRVIIWRVGFDREHSSAERNLTAADFSNRLIIRQDNAVGAIAPGTDGTFFATETGVWKRPAGQSEFEPVARFGYPLLPPYAATIRRMAFSPDGKTVTLFKRIKGTWDINENDEVVLERWDTAGHGEYARAFLDSSQATHLVFQPGGETVFRVGKVIGYGEPALILWSPDGAKTNSILFSEPDLNAESISQAGDFVINADDKTAILWDVWARKKAKVPLDDSLHEVKIAAVSPGGKFFALSGKDASGERSIVVYSKQADSNFVPKVIPQKTIREEAAAQTGKDRELFIHRLYLSEDGSRLAVLYGFGAYGEMFVRVLDVGSAEDVSPRCLKDSPGRVDKGCLALVPKEMLLSPDGRFLVATDNNRTGLLELRTGKSADWKGLLESTVVTRLAFSRDGRYLGVGTEEGLVHVFETERPDDEIARLRHTGSIVSIAFSDDGKRVATANFVRNANEQEALPLHIWHLQPDALLTEAASRLADLRKAGRMTGH